MRGLRTIIGRRFIHSTDPVLVPQSETFVQVLDVNSKYGIKETWQVWKTDDTPLGISQTVHTGSEIKIAGQGSAYVSAQMG